MRGSANRLVRRDGDAAIDGVPGTAAPVHLAFLAAAGSKTGKLLPPGAFLAMQHAADALE